ncbi:MAG: translation initiation factor IF-2, partial [Kiritimatiellae bacterium]|nr:translation initiation factor IF-2 [Kiritimatiellia bacterium]
KGRRAGIKPFASIKNLQPKKATKVAEAPNADISATPRPETATKAEPTAATPASPQTAVPKKPAPQAKPKKQQPSASAGFSLGGFGSGDTSSDGPSVVFHPAATDDYYEEEEDDRASSRDYDDEGDEELQREYFGGRRIGGSSSQPSRHHRDDARDDGGRSKPQKAKGAISAKGATPAKGVAPAKSPATAAPAAGRPGLRDKPLPASPFPTRPGTASAFPTRPGAASAFPTRPGATSAFPTRAQATPARQPFGQQNRFQQQGKNQFKDQRAMSKNQRQAGPQCKKPPAAPPPPPQSAPIVGEKILSLKGPTLIRELAEMMDVKTNRLIADLMQEKVLVSINQRVEIDMAGRIAAKYGFKVELEKARRSTERKPEIRRDDEDDDIPEDKPEDMRPRPPVVTFLGHVDHGKTSLLDYIRKTKVAAGEAGGITQHIGAYSVDVNDRRITFLDTPGHAAFSAMRARGARLTDIAVIVIAADDGIMPQTREVIRECRQANVQMMVAINKCDLPAAKPDRIRQQLQGEGLTPEDWGGDVVCCEVSAHTGAGMDNLLEMILLQADVLELQANPNRRADGYVIEAQMERGIGPTATLLVASGTLKVGDIVLIDDNYGRLRALIDDRGNQVKSVGPAQAVRVMGLSGVPEAGASFRVMTSEKRARELAEKFAEERKSAELQKAQKSINLDSILDRLGAQEKKQLSIIVKADTQGTVEAIIDTLKDIRSNKISLEILGSSIGNVTANDVQRAAAGHAMIVGFQVNTEAGVAPIATHDGVRINTFRIIYELFDFVKQSLLDMLDPEYKEVVKGHAQIRQIFDIGKLGKVAGCQLLDGVVRRDAFVRIKRLRDVLFQGKIASLKHFKDEVSEVRDMQEFGVSFVDFEDFAEGDVIECYAMEELERTL